MSTDPIATPKSRRHSAELELGQRLSVWYEIYIDLLGSLIPGFFAVVFGGMALALVLPPINLALSGQPMGVGSVLIALASSQNDLHWEITGIILVSAFIIGSVFFRQDPKRPDAASALLVWMQARPDERCSLAVQCAAATPAAENARPTFLQKLRQWLTEFVLSPAEIEQLRTSDAGHPSLKHRLQSLLLPALYNRRLGLDTQFPYLHLRCYLASRGLDHLVPMVTWCPRQKATHGFRSKMFINILKVRLQAHYPWLMRDVIRNEAHVRMAMSVWYAVTALLFLAVIVGFALLIAVLYHREGMTASNLLFPASFLFLLFVFCAAMRLHLSKCIHYMRVREVIYVLETAYVANKYAGVDLFAELTGRPAPNGVEIKCTDCVTAGRNG